MIKNFMNYAIKEAQKAFSKNLVPIGCVIVKDNKIIAKAHNKKFWHAEILCIDKAIKKFKTLDNCSIYVTIEPCPMCLHAIKLSKIKNIFYGFKNKKNINYKVDIIENFCIEECKNLMKNFFIKNRKKIIII